MVTIINNVATKNDFLKNAGTEASVVEQQCIHFVWWVLKCVVIFVAVTNIRIDKDAKMRRHKFYDSDFSRAWRRMQETAVP